MKKILSKAGLMLSWILLLGHSTFLFAQKQFSEGTLQYHIQIVSNEAGKAAAPIATATQQVYLKAMQSRTEMTSNLGTETTLFDQRQGKAVILKDYSGQKLMITLTRSNWAQKNVVFHNLKFNTSNPENVQIGDYSCKTATATTADGHQITVYYLPDYQLANVSYNNAFSLLPGIPVRYELNSGNLLFQYELTSISTDPVPATRFDFPKSGYRIMSYEESQQMKKNKK
jgi:hypothetical protein